MYRGDRRWEEWVTGVELGGSWTEDALRPEGELAISPGLPGKQPSGTRVREPEAAAMWSCVGQGAVGMAENTQGSPCTGVRTAAERKSHAESGWGLLFPCTFGSVGTKTVKILWGA